MDTSFTIALGSALFAAIFAIGYPLAKGFAARLASGPREASARLRALEAELQFATLRLSQAEEQIAELSEKLGFMENILSESAGSADPLLPARGK